MKDNKGVSVPKHYLKQAERIYEVYTYKTQDDRRYLYNTNKDVGCQYENTRPDITCAYRNGTVSKRREMYYSGQPKQVYAYHGTRSVTDVGVGSVKALPRKRIKRIYLPETDDRGIGSADLSAFVTRRTRPIPRSCYYDYKKTSSKCVGGTADHNIGCVLSEKLSPIVQTRSEATSPSEFKINTEMASNTVDKDMMTTTTQVGNDFPINIQDNAKYTENQELSNTKPVVNNCPQPSCSKDKEHTALENSKLATKNNLVDRGVSSDSLVQHVHNLENPCDYKQSRASVDPMENKLEREYRKMFTTKPKDKKPNDKPDMKSASILRRRFEALRRGMVKKEDSTKNAVYENQESNQPNCPIRKDVSIASDPPSLEGRSYSNTKTYSPFHMKTGPEKPICKPSTSRKRSSDNRDKGSLQWPQVDEDYSDSQGVKGMFKLWGKKFDFEEDSYKKRSTPVCSYSRVNTFTKQPDKKAELKLEKTVKKDGKKFFFFKKKRKEEPKPYKAKKGLTAGRCEVGEGLLIKMDGNVPTAEESKKMIDMSNEILRQKWLCNYLTPAIESKKSVQIRWNNNIYATSSSTVFELMDTVYQHAGIVFRSKSEVTTGESSFYKSRTQHVNFAHQEIEAWMIPKTVIDLPKQKRLKMKRAISKHNTEVRMSAQKWFIDKAKAFSRKIEVVLHTKNVLNAAKESSSEYLRIDIPKGFFIESSSADNRKASSDEEVFKIVEYETASDLKRNNLDMDTGDHPIKELQLLVKKRSNFEPNILENVVKRSHDGRDVVDLVSDVNIPKPCDVIGVGIITQKDLREIRKPILKIQENLTDEESTHILPQSQKKCEFAESFLQDYYRHWTPLGMERYSGGVSESHLRSNSQNSQVSFHNQGDGSQSCFNIYDGFQTSAVLSSNHECEPCAPSKIIPNTEYTKPEQEKCFTSKLLKKLHIKKSGHSDAVKRSAPKDSFEVFKKRKLYAASDKSKWMSPSYCDINLSSTPSIEDADTKSAKVSLQKKPCKKHVSVKDDGTYQYIPKSEGSEGGILMFRGASGCDLCREAAGICPKHAKIDPVSCEIPDPPSMVGGVDELNPPGSAVPSPNKNLADSSSEKQDLPPPASLQTEKSIASLNKNGPELNASSQNKCSPCNPEAPKNEATILCPHFPPCRVSQSCQKSQNSRHSSLQDCLSKYPSKTQSLERVKNKSPDFTAPPCLAKDSNEIKTSPTPKRDPSLSQNPHNPLQKPGSPTGSSEYPWPLKSQNSNQSITEPPACIQCKSPKDCPLSPELSANSVTTAKVSSVVDCKANCGSPLGSNGSNINSPSKSPASRDASRIKECVSASPADGRENKRKLSKVSVKIKQSPKKINNKDCLPVDVTEGDKAGVIRLSSNERITISMKKPTPSTEEIREGMNIKVRDYDGNTLYERIDYKKGQKASRPSVLGDMYKPSDAKRISTPLIIKNIQTSQEREQALEKENKSDASIGNVIEIQFKLKITPGDKSTELNTEKNKNNGYITKSEINSPPQDIFVVKNSDDMSAKSSVKNDVNIRIVIKNLKTKSDKTKNAKYNDEFSKKISTKFQTVSTGYSDVYTGQNIDKGFSIHRATIDLTDSNEKSKAQSRPSENKNRVEFADQEPKLIASSHELNRSLTTTNIETDVTVDTSNSAEELNNQENAEDIQSDIPDEEVRLAVFTDSEDQDILDATKSNTESGILITHPLNKKQKKELLKKVFEKADKTKIKSKDKMKKLRDMLKVVLTSDSSGHDEMAVTSNELLKDVTFASLRPDFFKDTDSINNPYNIDSIVSLGNTNEMKYYPTGEQNSEYSKSDEEQLKDEPDQGCICSTFADRLKLCNLGGGGCCCRGNKMKSAEISCDIKIEDEYPYMDDAVVELLDVETQNSRFTSGHTDKKLNLIKNEPEIQFGEITSKYPIQDNVIKKSQIDTAPHAEKGRNTNILNRNVALNISGEDKNILLKATPTNVSFDPKKSYEFKTPKMLTPSDILQSYATKKAVLEIYAETTVDADGEHTVAKLPKFVYDKESEICRYQQKLCNYNSICKRNIVMMSIQR